MIPIERPPLDAGTQAQLSTKAQTLGPTPESEQARKAWSSADTVKKALKQTLGRAAYRCWFCMYCQESRGTDIDHFHPITSAPHLAFTWTNHLLACGYCNQTAKREHFPTDHTGHPLLLDPTVDDSGDHLMVSMTGNLIPLSPRGRATVDVLHLNSRPAISDAREQAFVGVLTVFYSAQTNNRPLTAWQLRGLGSCALEILHLLAHAIQRGDCARLPYLARLTDYAPRQLPELIKLFPSCSL